MRKKLDNIKKSKIWLDFKVRTYEFFYYIYQLSMNKYYINLFNEIVEDRKKLNFDGKLIKTKISRIVVMNSYLSLYNIYESINENNDGFAFRLRGKIEGYHVWICNQCNNAGVWMKIGFWGKPEPITGEGFDGLKTDWESRTGTKF